MNLAKDWYLQSLMDRNGFVDLPVLATFPRVRALLALTRAPRTSTEAFQHGSEPKLRRQDYTALSKAVNESKLLQLAGRRGKVRRR